MLMRPCWFFVFGLSSQPECSSASRPAIRLSLENDRRLPFCYQRLPQLSAGAIHAAGPNFHPLLWRDEVLAICHSQEGSNPRLRLSCSRASPWACGGAGVDPGFRAPRALAVTPRFRRTLPRDQLGALSGGDYSGRPISGRESGRRDQPDVFMGDEAKFGIRAVEGRLTESHKSGYRSRGRPSAATTLEAPGGAPAEGPFVRRSGRAKHHACGYHQ